MRYPHAAVTLALALTLVAGCAADRHLKRGDEARYRGDPAAAQRHYEKALLAKSKLEHDPGFMETLRLARRDAALHRGHHAMRCQQWAQAFTHYNEALTHEPGFEPAQTGRDEAASRAAANFYQQAVDHADRGNLSDARIALEDALRFRPGHHAAGVALDSL